MSSSVGAVSRQCREQCRLTLCRSVEECRGLCRVCVGAVSTPLDRSYPLIMSMCVGVSECRSVVVSVCRSVCRGLEAALRTLRMFERQLSPELRASRSEVLDARSEMEDVRESLRYSECAERARQQEAEALH